MNLLTNTLWKKFMKDGIVVLDEKLNIEEVSRLSQLLDTYYHGEIHSGTSLRRNIVECHPYFSHLIDHEKYFEILYGFYGEQLKLIQSEWIMRGKSSKPGNPWHFDGPRMLPFSVFSKELPLRIKVSIWLTDMMSSGKGNLVFVRGSHHQSEVPQYHSHDFIENQEVLLVPPGSIVLMYSGLWHRVSENTSDEVRKTLFYEYGPSWLQTSDRLSSDIDWLATITERQRVLMRSYSHPNFQNKPPISDVFSHNNENYKVPKNLLKHKTLAEKYQEESKYNGF